MRCCTFGARILIAGWAATPDVASGGGDRKITKPNLVPTNLMMMKGPRIINIILTLTLALSQMLMEGLHIIGCPAMISTRFDKTIAPKRVQALEKCFREGLLPPLSIASVYPLAELKTALKERTSSGSVMGSTIVCPPTRGAGTSWTPKSRL